MPAVDWSDLDLNNGAYSATYSQPPSYASFEHSRPPLTTSSSGEASEVDDYISHKGRPFLRPDIASTSAEELNYNRMSSSSFTSMPQTSLLSSSNPSNLDINAFLHTTASPTEFEEPASGMPLRSEAFAKHGFTVHDAQKMAHPETPTEAMGGLSLPAPNDKVDHVWAQPFDQEEESLVPECKVEDDWSQ